MNSFKGQPAILSYADWNFITILLYQSISSSNTRVSLLIMHAFITNALYMANHHSPFIKKNKEEGNSLIVGYRRYCYTTAMRVVCNLIIITCAYDDACISREREFPSYLINSLSTTNLHTVHSHSIQFKYVVQQH
jgi:hypothetical protein